MQTAVNKAGYKGQKVKSQKDTPAEIRRIIVAGEAAVQAEKHPESADYNPLWGPFHS